MLKKYFIIILMIVLGVFLINGCATLPKDFERPESHAYTETNDTRFGKAHHAEKAANPGHSGFLLLGNGLDAFVARALLAHGADRSIDVQYYLYHSDLVARLFTDQLLKAADRGVRVRLLVDDMDLEGRDLNVAAMDSHPNVEVRIFNPFSRKTGRITQLVTRMGSVTRRMHNKSFTVDNQVTILGGAQYGQRILRRRSGPGFFRPGCAVHRTSGPRGLDGLRSLLEQRTGLSRIGAHRQTTHA